MTDWIESQKQPCGYLREVKHDGTYNGLCAKTQTKCRNPHDDLAQVIDCKQHSPSLEFEDVVECLWKIIPKKNKNMFIQGLCDGCSGYDVQCEEYIKQKKDE